MSLAEFTIGPEHPDFQRKLEEHRVSRHKHQRQALKEIHWDAERQYWSRSKSERWADDRTSDKTGPLWGLLHSIRKHGQSRRTLRVSMKRGNEYWNKKEDEKLMEHGFWLLHMKGSETTEASRIPMLEKAA